MPAPLVGEIGGGGGGWRFVFQKRRVLSASGDPAAVAKAESSGCHGPWQVSIQTPNRPSLALWCPLLTEECSLIEQGRHAIAMPFVLRSPPSSGMLLMMTPALSVD